MNKYFRMIEIIIIESNWTLPIVILYWNLLWNQHYNLFLKNTITFNEQLVERKTSVSILMRKVFNIKTLFIEWFKFNV